MSNWIFRLSALSFLLIYKKQLIVVLFSFMEIPEILKPFPFRPTTNPLRYGEPERGYVAQKHIWGEQPKERDSKNYKKYIIAKEFQNIAVCAEDIEHLFALLTITKVASNYTNKLIGKYIIVEIQNILSCFQNLSNASNEFRTLYNSLNKDLLKLENEHNFGKIRNKIAAHKHADKKSTLNLSLEEQIILWKNITFSSLRIYYNKVAVYINQLDRLASNEYQIYFLMNGMTLNAESIESDKLYCTFYSKEK